MFLSCDTQRGERLPQGHGERTWQSQKHNKVYATRSQTGLRRKGSLLDSVTEKSGLGCGYLPSGVAGSRGSCKAPSPGSISISLTSVLAFFPRGTPMCTFPGVVEGWSQQYLNPVDGDWGAEVSPRENGVLDRQGQEKPSDRPPPHSIRPSCFCPHSSPRASLPCGVPAGRQAALGPDPVSHGHPAPCSGAPRCATPPPLRNLWLTAAEAQLLAPARGPCPERRASRRVLQRWGTLLARQTGSVTGTRGWAPRGSGQSPGLSLPCRLPSPQRASVCRSCWPALPKGSRIPPLHPRCPRRFSHCPRRPGRALLGLPAPPRQPLHVGAGPRRPPSYTSCCI